MRVRLTFGIGKFRPFQFKDVLNNAVTSLKLIFQLAALRKLSYTTVSHRLTSREDVVLVSICFSPVWDGHSSGDCGGEASPGPPNVDGWPQGQERCKQSK